MSWQERADHMNAQGDLNCTSLRNNQFALWTRHSIREPFERARKEFEFEREMDELDPAGDFLTTEGDSENPEGRNYRSAWPRLQVGERLDETSANGGPGQRNGGPGQRRDVTKEDAVEHDHLGIRKGVVGSSTADGAPQIARQDETPGARGRMAVAIGIIISAMRRLPNQVRRFLSG